MPENISDYAHCSSPFLHKLLLNVNARYVELKPEIADIFKEISVRQLRFRTNFVSNYSYTKMLITLSNLHILE